MIIWIVKKHDFDYASSKRGQLVKSFEVVSCHATKKQAMDVAKQKDSKAVIYAYRVGRMKVEGAE